ncbi:zinc finger domain-containing protein [Brachybacterium sp. AOP24-D1-21]|uniref:zinc finger domain-containing protein n=1 Tax=Brachybacterium sp. AOP24-D1-21 TaxID=3457711 RepID=UPI0040334397
MEWRDQFDEMMRELLRSSAPKGLLASMNGHAPFASIDQQWFNKMNESISARNAEMVRRLDLDPQVKGVMRQARNYSSRLIEANPNLKRLGNLGSGYQKKQVAGKSRLLDIGGDIAKAAAKLRHADQLDSGIEEFRDALTGLVSDEEVRTLASTLAPEVGDAELERADLDRAINSDALLLACFERVEPTLSWLNNQFPGMAATAINAVGLAVACAVVELLALMPMLFYAIYGPEAFVLALLALGVVRAVERSRINRLGMNSRLALQNGCPWCFAPAGVWCVTLRGQNPGSDATHLHRSRG